MDTQRKKQNHKIQHLGFLIVFAVGLFLAAGFACETFYETRPGSATGIKAGINPNNASAASLARLPGIGVSTADSIIKYRNDFATENKTRLPFESADDLDNVYGIGPATIKKVEKFLTFDN